MHGASAILLVGFAATSCGDESAPDNRLPVAAFTASCTYLVCTFTDGSTDPDGNSTITSWNWDFGGDGSAEVRSPSHTFSAAGQYDVELTVTDDEGASNTVIDAVVVVENQPPIASFTAACVSLDCTFTDTSTDPDGSIVARVWDFGESGTTADTSAEQNPVYSYPDSAGYPSTLTWRFSVRLRVTDSGGATNITDGDVDVTPPAWCDSDLHPEWPCDLTLEASAKVTVTLLSVSAACMHDLWVITTSPVTDTLFSDVCSDSPSGSSVDVDNGAVYSAGTKIKLKITSPLVDRHYPPYVRIVAGTTYPTWELEYDDGWVEISDLKDVYLRITATPP
jgi:hypothetical protein